MEDQPPDTLQPDTGARHCSDWNAPPVPMPHSVTPPGVPPVLLPVDTVKGTRPQDIQQPVPPALPLQGGFLPLGPDAPRPPGLSRTPREGLLPFARTQALHPCPALGPPPLSPPGNISAQCPNGSPRQGILLGWGLLLEASAPGTPVALPLGPPQHPLQDCEPAGTPLAPRPHRNSRTAWTARPKLVSSRATAPLRLRPTSPRPCGSSVPPP